MNTLIYVPWLIKEIFVAGFTLAWAALRRDSGFAPIVIHYPLRVTSDWHIFWFSTSITVTPGTLSLGLREATEPGQPRTLLVQAVQGADPADVIAGLADMEARLAPHVRDIDYGVPGQGDHDTLDPRFYELSEQPGTEA
ncbi:monovalent cation/H+ antiporter subunit E [Corynebacterium uberis]|uniref:monovalent cation/H+ antiporter subunit E n=1 Tax=Corynebacterium TaxID=1716 RepID=UPI001D0BAC3A|nr:MULTISPECIES: monovalent cation/H+ antiporter subunit E [Corynebacterium]MCZ9309932.1 monovalent cation/H+ antiporter subunit E [Corynebacterium sp. c6VSa_13]UDL73147.1 monovalent cation/H+ antiporter subunit E [Corynebacterium uberis]UDL75976.1 monovalent cation/H+ antiporter subunit E [Corynebacterium uberis]UDL78188.1 monovalent cation/H+ antiporter subunit E [Corynebacterium uberis]UDL80471.1 monovalent cation/H+ antiporter subunit E [Corynebacterium uberis]